MFIHQHNRCGGGFQQRARINRQRVGVRHHHRQRFCRAMFARTKRRHRRRISGIAGQMEAANALHCHNATGINHGDSGGKRRLFFRALFAALPHQPRPALGAGHRLGVKTAVIRITVLRLALRAERKRRHHRQRAVIGHGVNNRKARPAVGAVDKRVAIAPLLRVVHFCQARRAGCRIRDNLGAHRPGTALADGEIGWQRRPLKGLDVGTINARKRRAVLVQRGDKVRFVTVQAQQYPGAVVADITEAAALFG